MASGHNRWFPFELIVVLILRYRLNPYHNAQHAADVLQAMHVFIINLEHDLPPLTLLAVLFASIIHDYGHPGVNNSFLYTILDPTGT